MGLRELGLNERQIEALRLMVNEGQELSNKDYRTMFAVSRPTATKALVNLVEHSLLECRGVGRSTHYVLSERLANDCTARPFPSLCRMAALTNSFGPRSHTNRSLIHLVVGDCDVVSVRPPGPQSWGRLGLAWLSKFAQFVKFVVAISVVAVSPYGFGSLSAT